ncbi:unnamed protein product [Linum trigynum]|uniref:Secreted protein n=1 Tax=Linum trigynum TaxID=586398 RepID=A0AAV2GSY6_9ROSI
MSWVIMMDLLDLSLLFCALSVISASAATGSSDSDSAAAVLMNVNFDDSVKCCVVSAFRQGREEKAKKWQLFSPPPSQVWTGTCPEQEEQSRAGGGVCRHKATSLPPHVLFHLPDSPQISFEERCGPSTRFLRLSNPTTFPELSE